LVPQNRGAKAPSLLKPVDDAAKAAPFQNRVPYFSRLLREVGLFCPDYRWHVLQLVMSFTLRTLYFFTKSVPSPIWSV